MEAEKKRLEDDTNSRTVTVEDIMLSTTTEEAAVLNTETTSGDVTNLSMLPSIASLPVDSCKGRRKKAPKSLWTYETVMEPTGAASKYWDIDAPPERRTKRLAIREKLTALKEAEGDIEGVLP